jgi:hypothetical protein
MVSKRHFLGTILLKDFSYKKLGHVSFTLHFRNSCSWQGGVSGREISARDQGNEVHHIFLEDWRGTVEFKKGVG